MMRTECVETILFKTNKTFVYYKWYLYIQMWTSTFECGRPHDIEFDEKKQLRPSLYHTYLHIMWRNSTLVRVGEIKSVSI